MGGAGAGVVVGGGCGPQTRRLSSLEAEEEVVGRKGRDKVMVGSRERCKGDRMGGRGGEGEVGGVAVARHCILGLVVSSSCCPSQLLSPISGLRRGLQRHFYHHHL